MRILLTNDDGPFAPGIGAMRKTLADLGAVTVVCPVSERSGAGHSITYMQPVRPHSVRLADGEQVTVLTGTPADCVKFAVLELMDEAPDLVVSGPNIGINAGVDVFYSGTVAAALEAGFYGLRAAAFSCSRRNLEDMEHVALQVRRVLELLLETPEEHARVVNVNVPRLGPESPPIRFTRQSVVFPRGTYTPWEDGHGRVHYWLDSTRRAGPPEDDSDVAALEDGGISVTPLRLDLTAEKALHHLQSAAGPEPEPESIKKR